MADKTIAELEAEVATLTIERDDAKADYLRRHNDACDRYAETLVLKAEVARLRAALTTIRRALAETPA